MLYFFKDRFERLGLWKIESLNTGYSKILHSGLSWLSFFSAVKFNSLKFFTSVDRKQLFIEDDLIDVTR